ncbi:MAG: mechanosensitive ion channel [Gammaproteobacteria bacterium]|nr:mechanosensitive ion channel [Woeseia sp.]NNF67402.1 mechanosensitive ion channel [Gammaproteobacteria bacterium]
MNEITSKISDVLGPAASSALGHALVGLGILIVGLLIVRLIVGVLKRVLNNVSALNRTNADGSTTDLVSPIASLFKAILTILVLIAVLQHFGLTDVLEPLKNMVNKFAAAVPNIIGAGVIGYAGWVIAKIVSQLVGAALGKVDEQIAERLGNKDISIAKLGSALIFAIILLPIAVSALGVLNIPSISEPASAMIQKLMAAVPNLIGAGIVMTVVFFVAKFVIFIVSSLLEGANINALPAKLGIQGLFTETFTPTRLIGGAIMFFSMVAAATAAVNILGIDIISAVFARVLEFGGGLLVGGLILIIGNFLGTIVYNKLSSHGSKGVANIARFAILGLVLAMGLKAMGLADDIVTMAFGFTLGSVAVAGALAFGLGGRDAAKSIADNWAGKVSAR